jgi:DNA polymerase I-like protein with 3'-5' exonuclease and polymerase domains
MGSLDGVMLNYVDTVESANKFMSWLGERRPVLAVDTETTGLKAWKDHVRLVQFGDAQTGWTFRWDRWGGVVQEAFAKYEEPYVFHNSKFDLSMLKRWCDVIIPSTRVHDTAIMARLLDPCGLRGLKPLATKFIDPQAGVGEAMLDKAFFEGKWNWETIPYEVPAYSVYAAMDTVLTARLFEILYPQIMTTCPQAYDLEREFAAIAQKIEAKGSQVDIPYTEESYTVLTKYMDEIEQWCTETYNVKPGSNQAVIQILAAEGIDFVKRTKGGALSLDVDVLEGIDHPLAAAVLSRRQTQKVANTYLRNFIDGSDDDGIIRPGMDAQGTVTGRMSMELFQTLPRRNENNPLVNIVRNCIIPREGNVLMLCDFDQIEMRVMAHLAKDEGLAQAFTQGDFFANVAREMFDDPTIVKGDIRRQHTKNAMYGKAYGAGIPKFSATAGISIEVGTQIMESLDSRFPGIREFQTLVQNVANERARIEGKPYVLSPLTRQPYYPQRDDKVYVLVNYMIQGMAASVLKMKVVELDNAGIGDYLTLLVHDEVIADVPRDEARHVADVMNSIMNDNKMFTVPITASVDVGTRWGTKGDIPLGDL